MKRILLGALGNIAALDLPTYQRQYGARRQVRAAFKITGHPTDKRYWHDLQKPGQAATVQAAKDKRSERQVKLMQQSNRAWGNNYAHHDAFRTLENLSGFVQPLNLNPFYVAK